MQSIEAIEKDLAEVKIIQELITTESNYNNALAVLEKAFDQEGLVQDISVCTQFKMIIPQLKVISDKLLANIQSGVNDQLTAEERVKLKIERGQLMKAFFHAYLNYPKLYDVYTQECALHKEKFKGLENFILQSTNRKHGLADLLSQPFQRGVRYKMLVTEALKSNTDLPETYILELKQLEVFMSEALKMSNSSMPEVKKPEPVSTSRFSIFGGSNLSVSNATPVSEQPGYKFGDVSRYLKRRYWDAPVSELSVVEESSDETPDVVVESGLKTDGPPTDLPPIFPTYDTSLPPDDLPPLFPTDNSPLPPDDLPPELPIDLVLTVPFTEPEKIVDMSGEVEDFDDTGRNLTM